MTPTELSGERGQAIAFIVREYEQRLFRTVSREIVDDIKYYYDRGIEPSAMKKAIELTALKGAGWQYTKGILKRLVEEGITTVEIWEGRIRFKEAMRDLRKRFPKYSEADLFPFAVIQAYRYIADELPARLAEFKKEFKNKPFNLDDILD